MKLIKVEAYGFKSFADKTVLTFDGGVVGIVGPNGSGKSNINDAIKWVLGERSAKSLRGDNMEDVIFSGSKTVSAMKKAEVTLTFDNTEGTISIPGNKISITRRLTRGTGNNEYLINGEPAKLRDINVIAMETGMSKSSLAIISQGTISDIAEVSPEERRGIFEEAAGVSMYKVRKAEALRKLERTSEALDKIKTVVHELERQLKPLERQAEKAKIFLSKSSELKEIELGLIVEDVEFFSNKLKNLSEELKEVVESKEDLETRIDIAETTIESKTTYKLSLENEVLILSEKFTTISERIRDLDVKDTHAATRRQMIIDGEIASSSTAKLEAIKEQLEELAAKLTRYKIWDEKAGSDISEKKANIISIESKISEIRNKENMVKSKLFKARTKIEILTDYKENKTNLFKGTKTILDNKHIFNNNVLGIVSDAIKVEDKYHIAIETVLKNALQHVVVTDSDAAVAAINFLKTNKGGRATFIPLKSIQPKYIRQEHSLVLSSQTGFVGIASDLVNVNPKFAVLKKFLLGNVIIAINVEAAARISNLLQKRYMIVTLDGDIIRIGGVMAGGEKDRSRDILGIDTQLEKLKKFIPILETEIKEYNYVQSKLEDKVAEERAINAELYIETAKIREKKANIQSQFDSLKIKYETFSSEKLQLKNSDNILESTDMLESEKASIQAALKVKRDKIVALNHDLTKTTLIKSELDKSLRSIIDSSSAKITEKNQAEFYIKQAKDRLAKEYEMTIEAAVGIYSLDIPREQAREIVASLRKEIHNLGYVNVESIETFEEVNSRYTKLKNHEEELFSAQQTILSAIDEMDQIIIKRLDDTVRLVDKDFQEVFSSMFGGGAAHIKYTDPKNLLTTGIDVIAQPPGKTVRNLKLFSGGEKALIAISLLFAILKAKPLPLSVLDEVEAALDEANVIRYANYLQELKGKTQFIVVTHRVGTMERVDHLFGATMQTRGVTSFFTVKLADAKKLID